MKIKKLILALIMTAAACLTLTACDKREKIDPFAEIEVSFSGIAPNGTMSYSGKNKMATYSTDVEGGLKNGDVVTITAELKESYTEEYVLTATEKEFTVEGLPFYAAKTEDIPQEMQDKMQKQAEDSIKASCSTWVEGNTFQSSEFLGYYFLTVKDGFVASPTNEIYCVYKVTGTLTGIKRGSSDDAEKTTGVDSYYTFYRYSDIMLLPDGTCSVDLSKGDLSNNKVEADYGRHGFFGGIEFYTFKGYKDLDSMFNDCVTKKIDKYEYENTVD